MLLIFFASCPKNMDIVSVCYSMDIILFQTDQYSYVVSKFFYQVLMTADEFLQDHS